MPFTVWRLMFAHALMLAGGSLMVLVGGIIGTRFAPSPALATLPIALTVVGVAVSTLPTGKLMHQFGRRAVFVSYAVLAIAGALCASYSLVVNSFWGFCAAAFVIGWSGAAGHQYRFAALEQVPPELAPRATSVLLMGGILGAFVGPEIAVFGRYLTATEYAGSYLGLACAYGVGAIILWFHREQGTPDEVHAEPGRRLGIVLRNPLVFLAIAAAAVGYGLMSLLMTATPISMHEHSGHSLQATKWVIQTHIAAMYLPSLIFAALLARIGMRWMMWLGVIAYAACLIIALSSTDLVNYWVALALLGLGWNFLFLCGTNLLPRTYQHNERFRIQSFNDFMVFTIQALATLGSGWLLFQFQWTGLLYSGVGILFLFALMLWRMGYKL